MQVCLVRLLNSRSFYNSFIILVITPADSNNMSCHIFHIFSFTVQLHLSSGRTTWTFWKCPILLKWKHPNHFFHFAYLWKMFSVNCLVCKMQQNCVKCLRWHLIIAYFVQPSVHNPKDQFTMIENKVKAANVYCVWIQSLIYLISHSYSVP